MTEKQFETAFTAAGAWFFLTEYELIKNWKAQKTTSTVCLDMSEAEISINELNQTLGLQKCKNIKKITFWKNLTTIDSYVFQDNDSLEAIEFSDNINSNGLKIDKYAFYNCSNLKKLYFL